MKIEVNWNGKEKKFETVREAEDFSRDLMEVGFGSDVWVDNKLHQTIMLNSKNGERVLFIYTKKGNHSIKI